MERWQQDSNLSSITPGVREVLSPAQRTLDSEGTRTLGSHMCSAADFHVLLQSLPQAMGGVCLVPGARAPAGARLGPLSQEQPSHLEQAACLGELAEQGPGMRSPKRDPGAGVCSRAMRAAPRLPARLHLESENLSRKGSHTNLSDPLLVPRSALRWPTAQLGVSLPYPCHLWTPRPWGVSPPPPQLS